VIQADGGTRTASITGAWVALHDNAGDRRQFRADRQGRHRRDPGHGRHGLRRVDGKLVGLSHRARAFIRLIDKAGLVETPNLKEVAR
jgi:ribonuclease PH